MCVIKSNESSVVGGSSEERKMSGTEYSRISGSNMEGKIEAIYKMIKGRDGRKDLIKRAITEAMDEEMNRVRQKIQAWKEAELKSLISSVVKKEVKNLIDMLPMMETDLQKTGNKKSYSKAVSNKQETVFIMKPVEENDVRFSEMRKRDIKIKIDVSKIGVGITKMKQVTSCSRM